MARHVKRCPKAPGIQGQTDGRSEFKPDLANIPIVHISFRLLPPGTWDITHVIDYYNREARSCLGGHELQPERLDDLKSLRSDNGKCNCYVGTELWLGYVVFEFDWSKSVVLECPIEGNATYVISGDWQKMVRLAKGRLRAQFPKSVTKVVHKGDWLGRVWEALYTNSYAVLSKRTKSEA